MLEHTYIYGHLKYKAYRPDDWKEYDSTKVLTDVSKFVVF